MKESNIKVSVIVPIYNIERYLQNCINSIRIQTYPFLEIILIDDGSPDSCGIICDKSAVEDSRIIVIHKENEGLSKARNIGLDIAKGEYIVFVDGDDIIHPRFVEILLGLCEQYDCDIAQCDFLTITEDSTYLPLNSQQSLKFYNKWQSIHALCCESDRVKFTVVWNKIYKKRLFEDIRYPIGRIHEDEFTTYKILWKSSKVISTNQYLYYYLQRSTSITGQPFSLKRLDCLDAFRERANFLNENSLEEEYYETLHTLSQLIEISLKYMKKNIEENKEICNLLKKEKKEIDKIFPLVVKREKLSLSYQQMVKSCTYQNNSRIVLYGAGEWGKICYRTITKYNHGIVVGWVDNSWKSISCSEYLIMPIDSILKISYDYIIITIKSRDIQKEIINNLISWGISKKKIITIPSLF